MDFLTSTIGSVAGPLIGGLFNARSQKKANETNVAIANQATKTNVDEAQKNRDFQMMMSSTAYQRAQQDLQKAGINPILAGAQPAATTGGATGSAQMAQVESERLGDAIGSAASSALEANRIRKEVKAMESQVGLNDDLAKKAKNEAALTRTQNEIQKSQKPAIEAESKVRAIQGYYDAENAKLDAVMKRMSVGAGVVGDLLGGVGRAAGGLIRGGAKKLDKNTPTNKSWGKINKKTGEIF